MSVPKDGFAPIYSTCRDCRWFGVQEFEREQDYTVGTCQRYAPEIMIAEGSETRWASWPTVRSADWCGEFQWYIPKEADK